MRFPAADVTGGRMLATAGDGIVREYAPASAQIDSCSTANYFTSATGAGGPDLVAGSGSFIAIKFWDDGISAASVNWSYTDAASGWSLFCNGTGLYLYLHNPTAAASPLIVGRTYGMHTLVITRTAAGAIKACIDGGAVATLFASPTYINGTSEAREYVGKAHASFGAWAAAKMQPIAWLYGTREASDAELQAWTDQSVTDLYHFPASLTGDAAVTHYAKAEDWDGSSSTITPAIGSRTLTKTGSPTKGIVAAETVYTVPAWAWHDSPRTNTLAQRTSFARYRVTTSATRVAVINADNLLDIQKSTFTTLRQIGVNVGSAADGSGGTWTDRCYCRNLGGRPDFMSAAGLGAGAKTIDLIEGIKVQDSTSTPILGNGFTSAKIRAPSASPITFVAPTAPASRLLIIGDSIPEQVSGGTPANEAWSALCRRNRGGVAIDCVGSSGLRHWAYASGDRAASVARWSALLDGTAANTIWFALGTNDYGLVLWGGDLVAYGTCWGQVYDDIHTARPDVVIYAQTPILRTADGTLGDWRAAQEAQATGRAWVHHIDGTEPTLTRAADGIHLTAAGHVQAEAWVRTKLSY